MGLCGTGIYCLKGMPLELCSQMLWESMLPMDALWTVGREENDASATRSISYWSCLVAWDRAFLSCFPAASWNRGNISSPPNVDGHGKFRNHIQGDPKQKLLKMQSSHQQAELTRVLSFLLITILRCLVFCRNLLSFPRYSASPGCLQNFIRDHVRDKVEFLLQKLEFSYVLKQNITTKCLIIKMFRWNISTFSQFSIPFLVLRMVAGWRHKRANNLKLQFGK